jgi:integrase
MPAEARGYVFRTRNGYGIRWPENGKQPQQSGFKTKTEARQWFADNVAPRLRSGAPDASITFDAFCDIYLDRHGATVAKRTRDTIEERLAPARAVFGSWTLRELEGAAADVADWRSKLTESSRYRLTGALRQALGAGVRWRYLSRNPAIEAGNNPEPPQEELQPFTREQVDALATELGLLYGSLAVFAAETGLRTNEWTALERRDFDRAGRGVTVQRRYADGVLTPYPKTARSRRRVPLTTRALAALDGIPPRLDTPLLFPASRGGYVQLDTWRNREWYPALEAAGIAKRGPYHLRHTFATEALAAGISIFELARLMGTSVKEIDKTYGHLARDSEQVIRARLNARGAKAKAAETCQSTSRGTAVSRLK